MPWIYSFHAWGEEFRPSQIDFAFTRAHDSGNVGTSGRYRNEIIPFGFADFNVPPTVPNEERTRYLVNILLPLMPELIRAGATDCYMDIGRFYSSQCNEAYSEEDLSLLASVGCRLHYSAYQVSEEEEMELQKKYEQFE